MGTLSNGEKGSLMHVSRLNQCKVRMFYRGTEQYREGALIMKMIIAIVNHDDSNEVCSALTENSYMFTKVSSFGGFLRAGNTTLLIGVEDCKVSDVMRVIREHCSSKKIMMPAMTYGNLNMIDASNMMEVTVGGATVFVIDAEHFEKF